MSDLINGREMLKRYQVDLCYGIACKECSMCTEDGGCRVEEWIDKFPSADRPSKEGEWEIVALGWHTIRRCSNCKWTQTYSDPKYLGYRYNFCPHCGARMKGADDDN